MFNSFIKFLYLFPETFEFKLKDIEPIKTISGIILIYNK